MPTGPDDAAFDLGGTNGAFSGAGGAGKPATEDRDFEADAFFAGFVSLAFLAAFLAVFFATAFFAGFAEGSALPFGEAGFVVLFFAAIKLE